jgi:hypothetical protein
MTLQGAGNGAIQFQAAAYSWAWNVEMLQWYNGGIQMHNSFRIQASGIYSHLCSWPEPGGAGYSFDVAHATSEILIQDSIILDCNKVMVVRSAGAGSVIAYNYTDDGWIYTAPNIPEVGINASHHAGSHHVLLEGNYSWNGGSDYTHGGSQYHTIFRNWLTGQRRDFTDSKFVNISSMSANNRWFTYIGNVLGYAAKPSWIWSGGQANTITGWLLTDPSMNCASDGNNCVGGSPANWGNFIIWDAGYDSERWSTEAEPMALSTWIRDGNYDFLTAAQHWYNTPGGLSIPNSMYLSSKPAFFGTYQRPWVDPATGNTYTLPALGRYNAGTPNSPIAP